MNHIPFGAADVGDSPFPGEQLPEGGHHPWDQPRVENNIRPHHYIWREVGGRVQLPVQIFQLVVVGGVEVLLQVNLQVVQHLWGV